MARWESLNRVNAVPRAGATPYGCAPVGRRGPSRWRKRRLGTLALDSKEASAAKKAMGEAKPDSVGAGGLEPSTLRM